MKKELLTGLFALSALAVGAQTFTEWQDPEVNAVNRYPMHTNGHLGNARIWRPYLCEHRFRVA